MIIPLIAAVTAEPQGAGAILQKFLPFQALGLLVVLITLALLCGMCLLVGAWFGRKTAGIPAAPAAEVAPGPVPPPVIPEEKSDPRIVAAIAAAISVTLDQPYRIVDIHAAGHAVGMTSAWAIEGRFQHFSSHKVR